MEILTMTVYANRYMKEERKQTGGREGGEKLSLVQISKQRQE